MTTRDIKPPAHQSKALRTAAGCVVVLVVLVVAAIGAALYLFTAPGRHHEHEEDNGEEGGRVAGQGQVRSFFEVEHDGENLVRADIELALGHVTVSAAERGALFQAEGVVAGNQLRPRFDHDRNGDEADISLSLDGEDVSLRGLRGTRGSRWDLYFSDQVPLDLSLTLGAADGDLDFSGIPVQGLRLECGMAKATLRFDEPNPSVLEELSIEAGLSEFTASGLGNARFLELEFDGGAGEFVLDFSGQAFEPGARAKISVGIASLTILLPSGQDVIVEAPSSFMTKVQMPASFTRVGRDSWSSTGTDESDAALHIEIDAGPGSVDVRTVE